MRPFNSFAFCSAVVLATLVGCNLHSGSGIDPNEIVEGGASDNEGDGQVNNNSSGGGSGGGSGGNSGGGSGSSSGGDEADASTPQPLDSGPGNCASESTGCFQCCENTFPEDVQTYDSIAQSCLCNSGPCTSQCANELCIGQPFTTQGDLCQECVDSNVQPGTVCGMQCDQNAMCQQLASCLFQCPLGK